ncbi:TetR/AcrR family transcriptional regulator, transcriptional repressor for nem operon [Nonomuraea maritima]|uniref:TetR/AcrR family transcriptional regulator, transcriptional repressor for nem operon n=1 Tax=Nonomuraea maritima TaxID=683260 RepID=A0A1G9E1V7_9ACTN|nr:TetR/AcrR family transcriptional regulator [Nonomuraea maritima]SDK70077.1 TetR/AcrR family transcriptional regulator, transcriptional repressor for nem operon [Nonomuraea maritima]
MARSKEFDPDVALQKALELFWERGYEATSMADLVERLGVARASIYATFGGKRELYLKALERYVEQTSVVEPLSQPGPALPAVRAFLDAYVAECLADELRRGCMVVNTAVEFGSRDPIVSQKVVASWAGMEAMLAGALVRARAQGELPAGKDPYALARFLLVLVQGVRVLGRADPDPRRLRDAVDQAMNALQI